jgi:hypothetical protein
VMERADLVQRTDWIRIALTAAMMTMGVAAAPGSPWLVLDRSVLRDGCLAGAAAQDGCAELGTILPIDNAPSASAALLAPDRPRAPARLLVADISELFSFGPELTQNLTRAQLVATRTAPSCTPHGRHRPDRTGCARHPGRSSYRAGSVKVKRAP